MAGTWKEQRESLESELSAIGAALPTAPSEFTVRLPPAIGENTGLALLDARSIVATMRDIEAEDLVNFESLAAASADEYGLSQHFASIADQIRLRIGVAESHLDILSLD